MTLCFQWQMLQPHNVHSFFPDQRSDFDERGEKESQKLMNHVHNGEEIEKKNNSTFMSSTKEGNPPIAMKVKNDEINESMDPLDWKSQSFDYRFILSLLEHGIVSSMSSSYLNWTVGGANIMEDSPNT